MQNALGATVLGKSMRVHGDVTGSEDLIVEGELHGSISVGGARVTLGPTARVRADILAQDVVIFGRLEGDIRASGRVELRSSAMVLGNIVSHGLSIEENAAFRGKVLPASSAGSHDEGEDPGGDGQAGFSDKTFSDEVVAATPAAVQQASAAPVPEATPPQAAVLRPTPPAEGLRAEIPAAGAPRFSGTGFHSMSRYSQYPAALAAAAAAADARNAKAKTEPEGDAAKNSVDAAPLFADTKA
jgi:cytoskeletal protein CcmA (bactofilin family)